MVLARNENTAVDAKVSIYNQSIMPSITDVVSSYDSEKEDVIVKIKAVKEENTTTNFCVTEGRDDISTLCLVDNVCNHPDLFTLHESPEEDKDDAAGVSQRIAENLPSAVLACNNPLKSPENGGKGNENSTSWCTVLTSPSRFFNSMNDSKDKVAQSDNNDDDDDDEDDSASIGSTLGFSKMFDDLESLSSMSTLRLKAFFSGTNEENNVEMVESSFMSSGEKDEAATGSVEMDDEVMEKAIEMKLSEMNVDGKVVRSASSPVRSTPTFLRSHSAPVCGERRIGATECANAAKSSQSRSKVLAKELRAARETYGRYDMECAKIMSPLGDIFYEEGDYERALTVHREASSIYSTKLGDIHCTTIDSNTRVGEALEALGRYDEAIQMYYNVLMVRKESKGDTDPSVADAGILIARALRKKKGRQSQALKELKRALKVYRTSLGDKHPKVSATVDDIASTYMEDGNFSKAALILDEVVKLKAATNKMYNADVAYSLVQLGIAQQHSGEPGKALTSMKKAYTIYATIDGENAEQTILTLERIGGFFRDNKDHKQAINAYMTVLKGKKTRMSDTDLSVADTYVDLGLCLRDMGDLDKASKCLKQSLTIYLQTSSDVQKVAQVMHHLGVVHQLIGAVKEAVKVFKQELTIRRKMGPSEFPQVARSLFHLGTAKYDLNDYPSALSFLTEALSIYEKLDNDLGLDFAETLFSTGLVFKAMRQEKRARHAFLESLKLFHSHGLGNDHELVKMATAKLNELGHKCECKSGNCNQVPCQTIYGTITI